MLLGELGDAQRLGEAAGAGRVELDIGMPPMVMKSRTVKAGQLALAMRQRDRGRRREPREIGRLQVPVQRLLQPEDVLRLDAAGEVDAVGQIVGRVHVEHQVGRVADRPAHRGDPRRLLRRRAGAAFELDRAVAELEKARQLLAVFRVGAPGR